MLVKEQIISELNLLNGSELLKIYEFINLIKQLRTKQKDQTKNKNDYLQVRKALENIKDSYSSFISEEREERL